MTTKKAPTKAEQAKLDAEKAEQAKAAQAETDAKAEAEKAEQAKAAKVEADAKAQAEEEAQTKADQAEADSKAEEDAKAKADQATLDAEKAEAEKAEPAALKPWNGEPLMPAPESETVETAKTSGKTYHVQWTLHHDGKRYKAGDKLKLSDDAAEDLVEAGVLVAAK